jgi:hypothetical protein
MGAVARDDARDTAVSLGDIHPACGRIGAGAETTERPRRDIATPIHRSISREPRR